jgi:hypothetical protein
MARSGAVGGISIGIGFPIISKRIVFAAAESVNSKRFSRRGDRSSESLCGRVDSRLRFVHPTFESGNSAGSEVWGAPDNRSAGAAFDCPCGSGQ